ncbi:MAG TPA: hypothetical protein VFI70_01730, partial [Nitrososphaeraceae archaeon]|nr:hypothetical protein [Nitrososphaeraceae archaeon]
MDLPTNNSAIDLAERTSVYRYCSRYRVDKVETSWIYENRECCEMISQVSYLMSSYHLPNVLS